MAYSLLAEVLDDGAEPAIFSNEFQSGFRANAFDGLEIIASEQDTQVNKLQ